MVLSSECTKWCLTEEALLDSIVFHPELFIQNLFSHPSELCIHLLRGLFVARNGARYSEVARGHLLWLCIVSKGIVVYGIMGGGADTARLRRSSIQGRVSRIMVTRRP